MQNFNLLIEQSYAELYGPSLDFVSRSLTGLDIATVEDVVSSTWLSLISCWFRDPDSFYRLETSRTTKHYVLSSLKNSCVNFFRNSGKKHFSIDDFLADSDYHPAINPVDSLELKDDLALLGGRERRVVHMRYILGESSGATAEILGLTNNTANQVLCRAMKKLRREVN